MNCSFLDGPAKGQRPRLDRAPLLLRVVQHKRTGKIDYLNHLEDKAEPEEAIHLYMLTGPISTGFWDGADPKTGRRTGGTYHAGEYALLPSPPSEEILRDNDLWCQWCDDNKDRIIPDWAKGKTT